MSVPQDPTGPTPAPEQVVSVDLAAFLPEGVELAGADDIGPPADPHAEGTPEGGAPPPSPDTQWRPDIDALDAAEVDLDAVDAALRSLDDGTYGACRVCVQPIADDLLSATPTRTTCADHA